PGPDHPSEDRRAVHQRRGAPPYRVKGLDTDHEARPAGPRGLSAEAAVVADQPGADRAGDGHSRRRGAGLRLRLDLPLPARPRQLDRGWHDRDPEEHHRRARARPTEDALGGLMNFDFTDDQQAIKATAHDLLTKRFKLERVRELA